MSRTLDLLNAIAGCLEALEQPGGRCFADVRVELDRYDLGSLLKENTQTPAARVCFMRGAPKRQVVSRLDRDVSIAIVIMTKRTGRTDKRLSSADAAVLDLIERVSGMLSADPYCGLGQLTAAEIGDELVAVSDANNDKGIAIGLIEAKWCLLDVHAGLPSSETLIGVRPDPRPFSVTTHGETIAPEPAPGAGT